MQSLSISQSQSSQQHHSNFNQKPVQFQFNSPSTSFTSTTNTSHQDSSRQVSPRQNSRDWRGTTPSEDQEERRPYSTETVSSDRTVTEREVGAAAITSSFPSHHQMDSHMRTLPDRRNRSIDEASSQWSNPPTLPQSRGSLPNPSLHHSSSNSISSHLPSSSPFGQQHQSPLLENGSSPRGRALAPMPRRSPILGGASQFITAPHSGQFVASPSPSLSDDRMMVDPSSSRSRSGSHASSGGVGMDYAPSKTSQSPRRSFASSSFSSSSRNSEVESERVDRLVYGNNFGSFNGREATWSTSTAEKRRWSADEMVEAAQAKTEKLQQSEEAQDSEMKDVSGGPVLGGGGRKHHRGSTGRTEVYDQHSRGLAPTPPTREEIMTRLQNKVKLRLDAKGQSASSSIPTTPTSVSTSVSSSPLIASSSCLEHRALKASPSLQDLSAAAASYSSASSTSTSTPRSRNGKSKMNSLPLPTRPNTADREKRAALGIETLLNAAEAAENNID